MKRFFTFFKKDKSGAVAVEFAFFAPIIIGAVGFTAMYGLATYDKMRMSAGTRSIMQYMMVGGADTDTMNSIMLRSSGINATINVSSYCSCSTAKDSSLSCSSDGTCAEGTKNEYTKITATATRDYLFKSWDVESTIDFRQG